MEYIQIGAISFSLFALGVAIVGYQSKKLTVKKLIIWIAIWLGVMFVALVPHWLSFIAKWLGIGRTIDVAIYGAIVILFYLVFRIYLKIEDVRREITALVQALAIREKKKKK